MSSNENKIALLTGCRDRHYAFGLITALAAKGLSLDVIGSQEIDSPELHADPNICFLNFAPSDARKAGFAKKLCSVLNYYVRLIPYAWTAEAQIFHILWNYRLECFDRTLLMLYYKLLGKKIGLTLHNVNAGKRDASDSWFNRLTLSIQYGLADHLFVHTPQMKSDVVKEFGVDERAVTVIPYGINNALAETALTPSEAKGQLGIRNGEKTILFFGNLGPYKGVEFLVEAFRQIVAKDANYRLIIAGKARGGCENYVAAIRQAIESYGIQHQAELSVEYVPDEKIERYFKAADVLVLPYRSIFQSGVLFLAYSFGLPVIATDVGSFREDIIEGKTGFLCKPDDSAELARVIERYFVSDLYRSLDRHRQEIRDYAWKQNSWEKVAEFTLDAYKALSHASGPIRPRADNFQTENRI